MRYVQRDKDGKVIGHFARPQPGTAEEALPDDHPDIAAFNTPAPTPDPVDDFLSNPVTKALIDAVNDGSLPVGQGLSEAEIKERIRGKMR